MAVAPERLVLIRELANDERVDRMDTRSFKDADWKRLSDEMDEETVAFCRDCTDPEELHAFVRAWNWDKGVWAIAEIIRNPTCEAATALMAYWTAGPEWYLSCADRDSVTELGGEYLEVFDLIMEIEARYVAGDFATGSIAYDPKAAGEYFVGIYDDKRDTFVRALPSMMYLPVLT